MFENMPPEVAKPVIGVARRTKKLVEDAKNSHAGFAYASVDKFYEDMGPIMAEEGLFIFLDEREAKVERRETSDKWGKVSAANWLEVTFDIYLGSDSGKTFGPIRRTQGVRADNATAYGSAASYVEKYFLRQLFKIPTGETQDEVDAQPETSVPVTKKPDKPEPDYSKERDLAIDALQMSKTLDDLDKWGADNKSQINRLPTKDQQTIRDAFAKHKKVLEQKKEAA